MLRPEYGRFASTAASGGPRLLGHYYCTRIRLVVV